MADAPKGKTHTAAAKEPPRYTIQKSTKSRFWEVIDSTGELVCLTAYRRGAREVVRRLQGG